MSEKLVSPESRPSTTATISKFEDESTAVVEQGQVPFSRLEIAQAAVDALNFRSTPEQRIYATKELQDAQATPDYAKVGDLIKIGKGNNTFHRPDGKFLSANELKLVYDNQNQIRDGIDGIEDLQMPKANAEQHASDNESRVSDHEIRLKTVRVDDLKDIVLGPLPKSESKIDNLADVELAEVPELEDEELDTSRLDLEKESIWNRISKRSSELYLKAGTTFGIGMYKLGNMIPKPTQETDETNEAFEKRVKRRGMYKVVGLVAVAAALTVTVLAAKHGLDHSSGAQHGSDINDGFKPGHYNGTLDSQDLIKPPVTVPAGPEFSPDALNVTRGEGWYQTFKEMGVTNATEQANLLNKVGPQLQDLGWAYPMPGGSWGISHSGQIPSSVLELIQNNR